MSVPIYSPYKASSPDASRAAKAYRKAERLNYASHRSAEWQRLNRAHRYNRSVEPFSDLFSADEASNVEDADFDTIDAEEDTDHVVRSAYLLGAAIAGMLCLIVGALILP